MNEEDALRFQAWLVADGKKDSTATSYVLRVSRILRGTDGPEAAIESGPWRSRAQLRSAWKAWEAYRASTSVPRVLDAPATVPEPVVKAIEKLHAAVPGAETLRWKDIRFDNGAFRVGNITLPSAEWVEAFSALATWSGWSAEELPEKLVVERRTA